MTEQELISIITRELTNHNRKKIVGKAMPSHRILTRRIFKLRVQVKKILKESPREQAHIINEYIEKSAKLADRKCLYQYKQGIKDSVRILKQLNYI